MNIILPKTLKSLSQDQRQVIIGELSKALGVSKKAEQLERSIWTTNDEPFLGEAEDQLYEELVMPAMENMAELIAALGLSDQTIALQKSFTPDFMAYEDQLIKALDSSRHRISDLINMSKKKRQGFLKYLQDGSDWTKKKLKQIDDILKQKLPDYAALAEQFAVRAAFIAKIRSHADTEMLNTVGAFIDRFPATIKAAKDESVVLTLKEQEKAKGEGRKVTILPLQPQELRAVRFAEMRAADKLTEISERHRAGVRQLVMQAHNERWTAQRLAQALFDAFGDQNRDWRRVAITELAMATNDAFLAGCVEGDEVWVPPVEGACIYCQKYLENKSFKVSKEPGNELTEVWPGKSNYGRKVKDWIPCIPLHPNCRHRFHKFSRFYKVDENGKPKLKTTAELIQEERLRRGMGLDPNLKV